MLSRQAEGREWSGGDRSGVEGTGVEWRGGEGRGGEGRAGQGRVPDCLGGLSRVGISSRSTRPWNGQPPSYLQCFGALVATYLLTLTQYSAAMYTMACPVDELTPVN